MNGVVVLRRLNQKGERGVWLCDDCVATSPLIAEIRAELGTWSADAARRYAEWRVEHEAKVEAAVRAERERIFKNLCLSCRDGITLGPEIAAATRAGATAKEDRHD